MIVDCDELLGMQLAGSHPLMICLLGSFRLVRRGVVLPVRPGGKTEGLLCALAMRSNYRLDRDTLLGLLWPDVDASRAIRSLNSLVHSLRRLVGDALHGAPPVTYVNGAYELNTSAGVTIDTVEFEQRVDAGDRLMRTGHVEAAIASYLEATTLYVGDAVVGGDLHGFVERERLRARHLSLLAVLADHHFAVGDYARALRMALRLLHHDPCREDAHRLAMRCYARMGARSQALRQYRVCRRILAQEYQAAPEPTTDALFRRLLTDPAAV